MLAVDPPRWRSRKCTLAISTCAPIFIAQGRYLRSPRLGHARQRRRPTRSMASAAITHLVCRAQIPIAPAARPRATSRGFLPWRLSDAGPKPRCPRPRPSSAGIRNPSQKRTDRGRGGRALPGHNPAVSNRNKFSGANSWKRGCGPSCAPVSQPGLVIDANLFSQFGRLAHDYQTLYIYTHRQVAQLVRELPLKREGAEFLVVSSWQHWCRRQVQSLTKKSEVCTAGAASTRIPISVDEVGRMHGENSSRASVAQQPRGRSRRRRNSRGCRRAAHHL